VRETKNDLSWLIVAPFLFVGVRAIPCHQRPFFSEIHGSNLKELPIGGQNDGLGGVFVPEEEEEEFDRLYAEINL
jgi:hypothetical protein